MLLVIFFAVVVVVVVDVWCGVLGFPVAV